MPDDDESETKSDPGASRGSGPSTIGAAADVPDATRASLRLWSARIALAVTVAVVATAVVVAVA